jgi:hypothetical protein
MSISVYRLISSNAFPSSHYIQYLAQRVVYHFSDFHVKNSLCRLAHYDIQFLI